MLIKSLLTPPSTLIDFLSLKIKGILKLSFGLYPQVGYIVIVLSFRTENRINIDQNYRSGDVWSDEFPIVSVKLFYWLEYFIQKNRTSLRDRSQFVAICVMWGARPFPLKIFDTKISVNSTYGECIKYFLTNIDMRIQFVAFSRI